MEAKGNKIRQGEIICWRETFWVTWIFEFFGSLSSESKLIN